MKVMEIAGCGRLRLHISYDSKRLQPIEHPGVFAERFARLTRDWFDPSNGVAPHLQVDSRVTVAVVGLACHSKGLIVDRSAPDLRSATAVLCRTLWGCNRFLRRFGVLAQTRPGNRAEDIADSEAS